MTFTNILTHFPLDKMAAILADDILKGIILNETFCISNQISLKFVAKGPIDNNSIHWRIYAALVEDELIWPTRQSQFNIFKRYSWHCCV